MVPLALVLFAAKINDLLYALPLIVAVSLTYAASRYEEPASIWSKAWWFGSRVALAMIVAFAVLWWLTDSL